jgi:hypothetical protein
MTMEQLEYFMVMLLIPKAMELSHFKKEAQMVIVNLVFYQHSLTLLSRHYFQQWTSTVAAAIALWQIKNHSLLDVWYIMWNVMNIINFCRGNFFLIMCNVLCNCRRCNSNQICE